MASDLINKYYNDVVVKNVSLTREMYDELENIADIDIDTDQANMRRKWLIKLHKERVTIGELTEQIGEFKECNNASNIERRPNHWTMTITSWNDFYTRCYTAHASSGEYTRKYEDSLVSDYLCSAFVCALDLLTMINEPGTELQRCIKLRFDKRTFGLYWQLPPKFHWENRRGCVCQKCACCAGFFDWSPVFRSGCDAWESFQGTVAEEFSCDFFRTHIKTTTHYGSYIFPRVEEELAGKHKRDDDADHAHKVQVNEDRVVFDLTDE